MMSELFGGFRELVEGPVGEGCSGAEGGWSSEMKRGRRTLLYIASKPFTGPGR